MVLFPSIAEKEGKVFIYYFNVIMRMQGLTIYTGEITMYKT